MVNKIKPKDIFNRELTLGKLTGFSECNFLLIFKVQVEIIRKN